jgi:hypothetical protein
MPILAIAGVPLPVLIDSMSVGGEMVGSVTRNQRGWRVLERRRQKLTFDFVLGPKTLDEAMMYRSLILGEGEFWNTLTSVYGAKGYALSGSGAWTGAGGGNPHNGNGVFRCDPTETMTLKGSFYDQTAISTASAALFGATAIGWRRDDAALTYRAFGWSWRTYDTTATVKREALGNLVGLGELGTPQAYTGNETFAVSSKNLVVTAGAGGPFSYSNIWVLPWYLKAAQIDVLLTGRNLAHYTLPLLPKVYVQSDLVPIDNQKISPTGLYDSSIICHGEVDSMAVQPTMQSGVFDKTTMGLGGRLIEV